MNNDTLGIDRKEYLFFIINQEKHKINGNISFRMHMLYVYPERYIHFPKRNNYATWFVKTIFPRQQIDKIVIIYRRIGLMKEVYTAYLLFFSFWYLFIYKYHLIFSRIFLNHTTLGSCIMCFHNSKLIIHKRIIGYGMFILQKQSLRYTPFSNIHFT